MLCSSIKVSSFAFPVIRLIAAGGVTVKASPSQEEWGEGSEDAFVVQSGR